MGLTRLNQVNQKATGSVRGRGGARELGGPLGHSACAERVASCSLMVKRQAGLFVLCFVFPFLFSVRSVRLEFALAHFAYSNGGPGAGD